MDFFVFGNVFGFKFDDLIELVDWVSGGRGFGWRLELRYFWFFNLNSNGFVKVRIMLGRWI